ncbi:MAG: hypothetical protein AAGF32_08440 [Pseudomonadota bacterium]
MNLTIYGWTGCEPAIAPKRRVCAQRSGKRSAAHGIRHTIAVLMALIALCLTTVAATAQDPAPGRWSFKPPRDGKLPSAGIIAKPYILTARCNPRKRGGRALTLVFFKTDAAKEKRHAADLASLSVRIDNRPVGEVLASKRAFKQHLIFATFVDMAADARRVMQRMLRAKRRIDVEINGEVARFPARGSTRALKRLRRACRL